MILKSQHTLATPSYFISSILGLSAGTPASSKSKASTGPHSENFTPTGDGYPRDLIDLSNEKVGCVVFCRQLVYLLHTLHRLAVFCEVGIKLFAVLHVLNFISHFAARFYFLY